jgi:hypothetical protein
LVMSFPKISDFFLITFYNAFGEVVYTLGTRVGTKEVCVCVCLCVRVCVDGASVGMCVPHCALDPFTL